MKAQMQPLKASIYDTRPIAQLSLEEIVAFLEVKYGKKRRFTENGMKTKKTVETVEEFEEDDEMTEEERPAYWTPEFYNHLLEMDKTEGDEIDHEDVVAHFQKKFA